VDKVEFNPTNSNIIYGAGKDKFLYLYDIRSNEKCLKLEKAQSTFCSNWNNNGNSIVLGSIDNLVQVFDIRQNKIAQSKQFNSEINDIKWYSTSKYVYISDANGCINIYE
jgi:WD40 repeat protein